MSATTTRRILVIDDNRSIHEDFRKILAQEEDNDRLDDLEASLFGSSTPPRAPRRETYVIHSAYQGEEGLEMVRRAVEAGEPYPLAFVDMRMPPGWDGVETIERLWSVDHDLQIVICSAYSDYSWDEIFSKFGAADRLLILRKPFDPAEVCQLACALTEKWHLTRRARLKLNQLNDMVAEQTRDLEAANRHLQSEVEQRRRSEERYSLAARGANDGLWDWDLKTGSVYYSPRFRDMFGVEHAALSSSVGEWFDRAHPEDRPELDRAVAKHLAGGSDHLHCEFRGLHQDQSYRWFLCRGVAVRGPDGQAVRAAGSLTNITDRKLAEERLRFEALHDSLTGLANRALLRERLSASLARLRRFPGRIFGVLFLDLDHFKVVNDSLGHGFGDKLLIEVAHRLSGCARNIDAIARLSSEHLARVGGDEFVLLLEDLSDPTDALRVADRIHAALSAPISIDDREVQVYASIGIAMGDARYHNPEDVLRDADTALYQAKDAGKSCTRMFDPLMHARAVARWQTETDLRRSIDTDDICVFYQPIVGMNGRLLAMEALVRWQHPRRGMVTPNDFIPIAEETGLIVPLGRQVLSVACTQLARWHQEFPSLPDLAMGVNVASRQFAQPSLAEDVTRVLDATGIDAADLRIEITESTAMKNSALAIDTIGRLRQLGVLIYMDDFGTGYSSLSQLHTMPIDALKIDRAFVATMNEDRVSRSIVEAIVALAHAMDLRVIAEGVETWAQVETLRKIGAHSLQGYYFSKPLSAADATAYIARYLATADADPGAGLGEVAERSARRAGG